MLLALLAFRAPASCREGLRAHLHLLEGSESLIIDLAEAMRTRWQQEERKCISQTGNSAVLEKWKRRMNGSVGAQVPTSVDMRNIFPDGLKEGLKAASIEEPLSATKGRRLHGKQAASPPPFRPHSVPTPMQHAGGGAADSQRGTSVLLAPPTAVSRSQSEHARSNEVPTSAASTAATLAPSSARPSSTSGGSGGELLTHRSLSGSGTSHGPAAAPGRYPPSQLVSALSRVSASENISSWPLGSGNSTVPNQEENPSPRPVPGKGTTSATALATSPEGVFVELTHVINMVHPTVKQTLNNNGSLAGGASCGKSKPPSIASELLISSALRLAWPQDRRKGQDLGAAASSCKDAATLLEEAAQHLRNTAADLDSGVVPARELKATTTGAGSESKRRRTFGGPSPPRAASPPAVVERPFGAAPPLTRASPPVCRGIRV